MISRSGVRLAAGHLEAMRECRACPAARRAPLLEVLRVLLRRCFLIELWLTFSQKLGMLTVDELVELEVLITEEIEKLQERSEESADEREAITPDVSIGRLSRLDSMQMQEIAKEGERRRQERLPRLEYALDLIDLGKYGKCERCQNWIPFIRLKEQPESLLCARCA